MKWSPECETSQRNKVSSDRSETPRCNEEDEGKLVREDERNKEASRRKRGAGGGGGGEDVNEWKSSAEHVSRRGVHQVSSGMKTNDGSACGNALLIVWSGGCWEFRSRR